MKLVTRTDFITCKRSNELLLGLLQRQKLYELFWDSVPTAQRIRSSIRLASWCCIAWITDAYLYKRHKNALCGKKTGSLSKLVVCKVTNQNLHKTISKTTLACSSEYTINQDFIPSILSLCGFYTKLQYWFWVVSIWCSYTWWHSLPVGLW